MIAINHYQPTLPPCLGHFEAYKLAEVVVYVVDEAGEALGGVLVSLSGGRSFRQNSLTEADGAISFVGLSPGDYFLRPMMKVGAITHNGSIL